MDRKKIASELHTAIFDYCEKERIFGSFRVTHRDEILYDESCGYANIETREPFTKDSLFSFYSLSKPFCVMGFMKLWEKGLVDLDAHPAKYVPEAEKFDARVTFRNMLFHRSGMPDPGQTPAFDAPRMPAPRERIRQDIREISAYPGLFVPGEGEKYCNINMILPALACENVTGIPYHEYVEKEVLRPLGMENTFADIFPIDGLPHRVHGHALDANGNVVLQDRCTNWLLGAGDLIGTVDDVYCLNREIKHHKLLSDAAWNTMLTPPNGTGYGMGCAVTLWHGKKRITHNGGHWGFRTMHIQLPEDDFDIIILSNSGYGDARVHLSEIIHSVCYGEDGNVGRQIEMDGSFAKA